ncbi:MAG: hypothetical protein J0L62_14470 [Bacteroidetes bacterium]|nr:hypothetical protein [Bacteroidota bacterium]
MSSLVCTLGTSTAVLSETLLSLQAQGKIIKTVHIFHTEGERVYYNQNSHGQETGLFAFRDYIQSKTNGEIKVFLHSTGKPDIYSTSDSEALLTAMVAVIRQEKNQQREVIVSIAGGRKTMSATAVLASILANADRICHVVAVEGVGELSLINDFYFDIPTNKIRMIDMPVIHLGDLLGQITEMDESNALPGIPITPWPELIDQLNANLHHYRRFHELYSLYQESIFQFNHLAETVGLILNHALTMNEIKVDAVHSRTKSFASFIEKIQRKKYADPMNQMEDLAGVRVVNYYHSQVENIISVIRSEFVIINETDKVPDYEHQFGYESYHLVVSLKENRTTLTEYRSLAGLKCEIQIRTIFDHAWAQIEHEISYKKQEPEKDKIRTELFEKSELLRKIRNEFDDLVKRVKNPKTI